MRTYLFSRFGLDHLHTKSSPSPKPGHGEVLIQVKAVSLNYRDVMVIDGRYHPKLPLPAVPISDGAGVVAAIGDHVDRVAIGDRVMTHFIPDWIDGPFRGEYVKTSLGTPGAGLAAEQVVLPAQAVLPIPDGYSFAEAATLPIAALTAWSALVTEGGLKTGQTVLTLGTGGVSLFALQLAKAMGVRVIITSSSDEKLAKASRLGADETINYQTTPEWDRVVLDRTSGVGVDVVVETGGSGTLERSLRATMPGGTIAFLGAITGLRSMLNMAPMLMKRLHLAGIYVDSRQNFEKLNLFLSAHRIKPIIDRTFPFEQLPGALLHLQGGTHFGKVVVEY